MKLELGATSSTGGRKRKGWKIIADTILILKGN